MKQWIGLSGRGLAAALLLLLLSLAAAAAGPANQRHLLGWPGDERVIAGFWPGANNDQERFRWSDGDSLIRFYGYETAPLALLSLRMTGLQVAGSQPVSLTLTMGDRELTQFSVAPSWRVYRVLARPDESRWRTPQVHLISATQRPGPQDQRDLGVAVAEVKLTALGGRLWMPLLERAAFFAALLSLLLVLLLGTGRALLAWGVTLLAALLLLAVSLVSPGTLAYLLPPLWRLLALSAGLIATLWLVQVLEPGIGGSLTWAGAGLLAALLGQIILRPQFDSPLVGLLGGALLVSGALLVAAAAGPYLRAGADSGVRLPVFPLLGLCFVLALALRLYNLGGVPFGMWRDEARHGLLALRILDDPGFRPVYVPDRPIRVDLPALLFYLQAGPISLLGPTVVAARLVPAIAGSLTVFPVYLLGRRLWGDVAGLVAALLLAISSWHIALSRFASPAVLDPFFTLSALVLLAYALDLQQRLPSGRRLAAAALGGVSLGLALYTYHTGRLMPAAAIALSVLLLGRSLPLWRRSLPVLAVFALTLALTAAPLVNYMLTESEAFNRRISEIGTFAANEERAAPAMGLEENVVRYTLMWNVEGEHNPRHHVPFVPLVDLFTGLLFVIGLLLLLRRWRLAASRVLLALLLLGLLPGILSSDAPHALRSIAAVAPTALVAAVGAAGVLAIFARLPQRLLAAAGGGLAAAAILFNIWVYFGHMPYDWRVWSKFEYSEETAIGGALPALAAGGPIYLTREVAETDVVQYLGYNTPLHMVSPSDPTLSLPSGALLLMPTDAKDDEIVWAEQVAGAERQPMQPFPGTDSPTFWVYKVQ